MKLVLSAFLLTPLICLSAEPDFIPDIPLPAPALPDFLACKKTQYIQIDHLTLEEEEETLYRNETLYKFDRGLLFIANSIGEEYRFFSQVSKPEGSFLTFQAGDKNITFHSRAFGYATMTEFNPSSDIRISLLDCT
ncbi:MAG: hypothetical protein COA71_08045 [SAR86 cluster bacterium]|uniref:Uncharacterized protein n=1 Tax=SAR86 cluster bacterium TaxID=2030880 RepID=A0A2A5CDF7_9GAMM|nr:hypothetical protein [Gammaproteobacteria bacterium AH-315-E17]PCJ41500.1 MAG: hypothetical protein COA71_08045 [SAR86 cluster bacterium]